MTRGKNKGNMEYKLVFPKGQKKWVAKPVKTRNSYSFVEDLMEAVFSFEDTKTDDRDTTDDEDNTTTPASIPKNIAPITRPSRKEIITAHKTRMGKNYEH